MAEPIAPKSARRGRFGRSRARTLLPAAAGATAIALLVAALALGPEDGPPHAKARLVAPGSPILADRVAAARISRSDFEPRPENARANRTVPAASELAAWRSKSRYRHRYAGKVSGNFTGTTDEILQWAAWKWGFDEDLVRAQAVQESEWRMSEVGDGGVSFGILQLKSTIQRGTAPLSRRSTAFNADYAMMTLRHCYDGHARWLDNGYRAGDFLGCLGYFFSGRFRDRAGLAYVRRVQDRLSARTWEQSGF